MVKAVDPLLNVAGNRELLLSALANLLFNAFKFTHAHSEVTLSARAMGDRVLIDVSDRCGGLSSVDTEQMFLPFSQRSTDKTGLGLGLSIARQSVEADAGRLTVNDVPGTAACSPSACRG